MSQRKKKLTSSFYTDEDSINYSFSRRQPKKTVVIDEKNMDNEFLQRNKKAGCRVKKPSSYEKSSTPKKKQQNSELTNDFNKTRTKGGNSYQDIEFVSESDESVGKESEDESDNENDHLSKIVTNEYLKAKNKLIKVESDLEILQFKYRDMELRNNTKINVLEEQLSEKLLNLEALTKKNQSLSIKIQELEIKFSKNLTLGEENKLTFSTTSNDSKNLSDSPVGCYLCKNKIMKNYVGFSIHFSRMHKEYAYENRSTYSYFINSISSEKSISRENLSVTPVPPKGLLDREKTLLDI